MTEPTFDADGYPTDETLAEIRQWKMEDDWRKIEDRLAFLSKAWHYPDYHGHPRNGIWVFATAGWSGNEGLLESLLESDLWRILIWNSMQFVGGLLIIATNEKGKADMSMMRDEIVKWAWQKLEAPTP